MGGRRPDGYLMGGAGWLSLDAEAVVSWVEAVAGVVLLGCVVVVVVVVVVVAGLVGCCVACSMIICAMSAVL